MMISVCGLLRHTFTDWTVKIALSTHSMEAKLTSVVGYNLIGVIIVQSKNIVLDVPKFRTIL